MDWRPASLSEEIEADEAVAVDVWVQRYWPEKGGGGEGGECDFWRYCLVLASVPSRSIYSDENVKRWEGEEQRTKRIYLFPLQWKLEFQPKDLVEVEGVRVGDADVHEPLVETVCVGEGDAGG